MSKATVHSTAFQSLCEVTESAKNLRGHNMVEGELSGSVALLGEQSNSPEGKNLK